LILFRMEGPNLFQSFGVNYVEGWELRENYRLLLILKLMAKQKELIKHLNNICVLLLITDKTEINYGFSPNFDFLAVNTNNIAPTVDTFMNKLRGIWTETVKNLKNVAIMMKKDSERTRREADFKVGQYV
jgi:hypothetical protein